MAAVVIKKINKTYNGLIAVKDLSFSVEPGQILGLIGPNGAGKSTTIKIILDFMKPDSGDVMVFGGMMNEQAKNRIGYLPEAKGLYKELTTLNCILYLASLKGMEKASAIERADMLLEQTGMGESRNKKIKYLSKGMGQMIQFIVTIIHNPELLILDEPFSGLDPVNTELMKTMIASLRDQKKAIILSTHQMNQVEELCDQVLMINQGEEVLSGTLKMVKSRFKQHSVQVDTEDAFVDLRGIREKKSIKDGYELVLTNGTSPQSILDQMRNQGITINRFEISTPSLHSIFLHMVGEDHE
jgi:ABC-2 type transport system ATP-binding protein